jgi:hypothetical protein
MTMRILSLTGALLMTLAVPHAAEPPMLELTPDGQLLLTENGFEQVLELDLEGNVFGRYGGPPVRQRANSVSSTGSRSRPTGRYSSPKFSTGGCSAWCRAMNEGA